MSDACQLVVLRLDNQLYGLKLHTVERVIQAIEVSPLPGAPASVMGAVNVQGQVLPVFNLRQRFGLPEQPLSLSDQIVLAHTAQRLVGVCVDAVDGVVSYSAEQIIEAEALVPGVAYVQGVLKLPDGLILIHDLDTFLSSQERQALDEAL
jgi:purine-binding chemotaxis protein CheW